MRKTGKKSTTGALAEKRAFLREGLTVLLVEQNTRLALAVADHVLVLHKGAVVFSGTLEEFRRDETALRGSYLAV